MEEHGYVAEDRLADWAREKAAELSLAGKIPGRTVAAELRRDIDAIDHAAAQAAAQHQKVRLLPPVFEWLLDNRYLCRREGQDAYAALKNTSPLPAAEDKPYVYTLAVLFAESGTGECGAGRLRLFLSGAQSVTALSERELWLFVPMLRAALLHGIAEIARELNALSGQGTEERLDILAGRMGKSITSLRNLSVTDLSPLLLEQSAAERALRRDPAGLYEKMDEDSRTAYRATLSRLAQRRREPEGETAEQVLTLCAGGQTEKERHVGYYLIEKPMGKTPSAWPKAGYFILLTLLTLLPALACAWILGRWWVGLLLLLPLSAMAKNITDTMAARRIPCRPVPRLALPSGLPETGKTLCVLSVILTDPRKGAEYAAKMEAYRHANRDAGENLLFGLLCDLPDTKQKKRPSDAKILEEAQKAVFALNRKYGGGFYLFSRERQFHKRDKKYMGWERKRGAILELCRLLREKPGSLTVTTGDKTKLSDTRYLITLDADTVLTPGSARQMAGGMLHPMNTPQIDGKRRIVVEGYGLLSPRISTTLEAAGKSLFSRVFAGQGGLDPYGGMAGEVFHDLFNSGSFSGKGIFDIDVFLICLDGRFPENRILSHDLLEGAYLGTGLLEDVELSDGYPYGFLPWAQRLHRWTRGDWQVSGWILPRVRLANGHKEKNPLPALSRFKLFEPLRRSLCPAATLAALTVGALLPGGDLLPVFIITLVSTISHLLISALEVFLNPRAGKARYHAAVIIGFRAALYQTVLLLLFLPYQALMSLHAVGVALWRVNISHKKLLQWVTSAETENFAFGVVVLCRKMFAGLAWGVITACLSRTWAGWLLGAFWASAPFVAYAVSKTSKETYRLCDTDRKFLHRQSALMWRYFDDFLTQEDNFLIPDNWQEQPSAGLAHRSSPTNIGLSLLCILAAADLNLCTRERALELTEGVLTTLESLPKWHGHIYNWYDTRTLDPLLPRCVSTVDSGNLCGCLIALRQGLLEWSEERAVLLSERAKTLAGHMDFRPLYDSERRLFVICRDMDNPDAETGCYDLMASEARQTSYIAVARGECDKKHWQRLSRAQTSLRRFRGMASWTGTMFEYFMPHLLLPVYNNSLLRESLDFAVYAQREQAARRGGPWGASESCFYAFDPSLNYQYKAHGIPALAFKRGLGKEWVISPYSSFLSLLTHPRESVKNLRRLHSMGIEGNYGLIEAIDYTPARRQSASRPYEEVRCYMSHHLGMSLLATCNALLDNIMQRRFMRDTVMGAFSCLLQERVPVGADTIRTAGREIPEKPPRSETGTVREFSDIQPDTPRAVLLGNASYSLLCTDGGLTASGCRGMALTRFEPRCRDGADGMRFYFSHGDGAVSLLPAPSFENLPRYSAVLENSRVVWHYREEQLVSEITASVPDNENAERRTVTLQNTGEHPLKGVLCCYFEPVLQPLNDYSAHPAFSKLFLETAIEEGVVLVRRRPRGGAGEEWLCFACDAKDVSYDTSREKALGRGGADVLPRILLRPSGHTQGAVLDPCVLARVPIALEPGGSITVCFALAQSQTDANARATALRVCRDTKLPEMGRGDFLCRLLEITPAENAEALDWLPHLVFPLQSPYTGDGGQILSALHLGIQGLWALGISGDHPIILAYAGDQTSQDRLGRAILQHRYLSLCGITSDLCIICRDGGDYRRPVRTYIMEALKNCHAEGTLSARGGVHLVDISVKGEETEPLLRGFARFVVGETLPPPLSFETLSLPSLPPETEKTARPALSFLPEGGFRFETGGALPPLGWSHILSNRGGFGALVTETGSGFSFYGNARENKLTPWKNDPLATRGGTETVLELSNSQMSLFAAADGLPCTVTYGTGWAMWEKRAGMSRIRTTQFVPPDRMALVTLVELEGETEPVALRYNAELLLGDSPAMGRTVFLAQQDEYCITAENPVNTAFAPQRYVFAASGEVTQIPARPGEVAVKVKLTRSSDGVFRAVLVSGRAANAPGLRLIRELANERAAAEAFIRTKASWKTLCYDENLAPLPGSEDEEAALRRYLCAPALYQVIAVRLFARTSLYQCGGAYGFRDQLQDSCAALHKDPSLTRVQILRACAHQYEEGDVMHWWHPLGHRNGFTDKGVRTRCSDDLLWLPYTVCEYFEHTADRTLLTQPVPYLTSPPLPQGAHDRYETAVLTRERGSVYEHCRRATDLVLDRGTGEHGLLLMGSGDWNDGMNLVGDKGRGESVWLTWFCAHVLERFSVLCRETGDGALAGHYLDKAAALVEAAAAAWDGEWFLRGYYDDGVTLGSSHDEECRIDAIAQSFSALFPGKVPPERVRTALENARKLLCDPEHRLIKVLTPPFTGAGHREPGYIKGYLPGVRENGGQYTHAAIWLAMGFMQAGDTETCKELLQLLLPETHDPDIYKAEPYALAADVYSHPQHIGRGGWSLYTGAASWFYRIAKAALEKSGQKEPQPAE